jgi:catechol 2,3-dioxygenase-like lactoylglutathione lyase family enzyme
MLQVEDVPASSEWYQAVLGLPLHSPFGPGA